MLMERLHLTIITGAPGTGKTTILKSIQALLVSLENPVFSEKQIFHKESRNRRKSMGHVGFIEFVKTKVVILGKYNTEGVSWPKIKQEGTDGLSTGCSMELGRLLLERHAQIVSKRTYEHIFVEGDRVSNKVLVEHLVKYLPSIKIFCLTCDDQIFEERHEERAANRIGNKPQSKNFIKAKITQINSLSQIPDLEYEELSNNTETDIKTNYTKIIQDVLSSD